MTAELWLVRPCKHGKRGEHGGRWNYDEEYCPGEYRVRLDPDVVFRGFEVKPEHVGKTLFHALVQDVIDALEEEE